MQNKFFDDAINLLSKTTLDIKNNVVDLETSITSLEDEINNITISTYTELDNRITELKKKVEINGVRIDNIDKEEEIERKKLLSDYYKTIVSYKNNFSNFNISNVDSLLNSIDVYTNESNNILNLIESIVNNRNNYSINIMTESVNIITASLTKYSDILSTYQNKLSTPFESFNKKINSVSIEMLNYFDSFFKNDYILKKDYQERRNSILNKIPLIKDLLDSQEDIYNIIYSSYSSALKEYEKEYIKSLKIIKNDFIENNKAFLNVINNTLIKIYSSLDITNKKRILLDNFKNEIDEDLQNKIIKINDSFELDDIITDIYKFYNNKAYKEYTNRINNLKIEYSDNNDYLEISKLFIKFNKDNKDSLIINNEIIKSKIAIEINNNYKDLCFKRLLNIHKLNNKMLDEISLLNLEVLSFLREKEFIELSFKNDLKNMYMVLEKEINLLIIDNSNNDSSDKLILKKSLNQFLKMKAQLEYNMNITKMHHDYISKKSLYKLDYELKKQEKNLELLSPNYKLTKIITEYETLETQFKLVYDSLSNTLNDSKIRNEALELSTRKYAYSLLNHRLLVSNQMLEMAKKEYELRIEILTEIRNTSSSYNSHRYNDIISKYLEQISDIEKLRNVDLNSILSNIEINNDDIKNENKFNRSTQDELLNILDKYDELINGVQNLLKNDKEIKFGELNKKEIDDTIFDGIESVQEIENSSIEVALKSIEKAHEEFNDLIDSLETGKIDYNKAYDSYKNAYNYEHLRLQSYLETESEPYLNEISLINQKYANISLKEYFNIDKEHDKETDRMFSSLLDEFYKIDKEYSVNEDDFNNCSAIKENKKDEYIKEFNKEFDKNENEYLLQQTQIKNKYIELFSDEKNRYHKELLSSVEDYKKCKNNINKKIKNIYSNNKKSAKILSKILLKDSIKYSLGYEAFEKEIINKIKVNEKKLKKKKYNISDFIN